MACVSRACARAQNAQRRLAHRAGTVAALCQAKPLLCMALADATAMHGIKP
jgi:hypothetical protein